MSAPDVTMIGGGMIAHDQLLPSLYHLQRQGVIGEITVCASHGRSLKALAEAETLRQAFPGQSFRPYPALPADLDEAHPDLFREVIARMPPRNIVVVAVPDQLHFEVITHEYPVLHEDSPLFAEAEARGYLLATGYERATGDVANYRQGQRHLDFSNPAVRAWWWSSHQGLVRLGVGGWWLDGGEGPPATATLATGDGMRLHNLYDRLRNQGFAEGEAATRPDQRVFLLCRSGAAGMQRFGASCWSGDVNNDFPTLEAQIPLGLNTGLSGIPYWGTDVGGFFHVVPETGELYARWFQFGAFCPTDLSLAWMDLARARAVGSWSRG